MRGCHPPRTVPGPRVLVAVLAALVAIALPGVAGSGEVRAADGDRLSVYVSILPQSWFVERIGGTDVEVFVLVGPGESPATYDPTPRDLVRLAESDVLFSIGVPFETQLLPRIRAGSEQLHEVDMASGIERRHGGCEEDHGHGHGDDHGTEDPHVWLDPVRARDLARNTFEALVALRPSRRPVFEKNLERLLADLESAHRSIRDMLAPHEGATIVVYHPAFGYFTDRYGLRQLAVEAGGLEPGPRTLASTIEQARAEGVTTVFVQPQSPSQSATAVAEAIGADTLVLDPLAPDYLDNLVRIGTAMRDAVEAR